MLGAQSTFGVCCCVSVSYPVDRTEPLLRLLYLVCARPLGLPLIKRKNKKKLEEEEKKRINSTKQVGKKGCWAEF